MASALLRTESGEAEAEAWSWPSFENVAHSSYLPRNPLNLRPLLTPSFEFTGRGPQDHDRKGMARAVQGSHEVSMLASPCGYHELEHQTARAPGRSTRAVLAAERRPPVPISTIGKWLTTARRQGLLTERKRGQRGSEATEAAKRLARSRLAPDCNGRQNRRAQDTTSPGLEKTKCPPIPKTEQAGITRNCLGNRCSIQLSYRRNQYWRTE
jgi:hypothetical protein